VSRFGGTFGQASGQFRLPFSAVVGGNYRIYIVDYYNNRVLVFDPSGKFIRKIGKKGGGPGEFMAPTAMTINSDGNIVVNDIGRGGYSIFKTDGTFVKNVLIEGAGGIVVNIVPTPGTAALVGLGALAAGRRRR
jgi:uncharacterized protein (TIGR03382 family)